MKFIASIITIIFLNFLSGCASAPPMNFSVPNVGISEKKIEADLKSLTVTLARPDEKTGQMPLGMEALVPQVWHTALIESLNRMAIFQDDAPKKVSLSVKILNLNIPTAGLSMTTLVGARYELIDRKTGDLIYAQDVRSSSIVPMDYAFMGETRARESINRAVQNNIAQFLQALMTVNLDKPMFPAKAKAAK